MNAVDRFLAAIQPWRLPERTRVRLGSEGDGGYVVLDELCRAATALWSFGIGTDMNFELDFAERYPDVEVILADQTIEALPVMNYGSDPSSLSPRFYKVSIEEGLSRLTPHRGTILKADVEWAEWAALEGISDLRNFQQIIVELHLIHVGLPPVRFSPYFTKFYRSAVERVNENLFSWYARVLERLNRDFLLYHLHPNNSLGEVEILERKIPPLLEMSFVARGLAGRAEPGSLRDFPAEGLDRPNKPDREDVRLRAPEEDGGD